MAPVGKRCSNAIRLELMIRYGIVSFLSTLSLLMRKKRPFDEPNAPVAAEPDIKALDERVRRSRATVLDATTQLLFERGFGGATVDEIARRSGVAKTTIYRIGRPEPTSCEMPARPSARLWTLRTPEA